MSETAIPPKPERLVALDAYRGFTMMCLVSGIFGMALWGSGNPGGYWDTFFKYQASHVTWTGCSLWDLIQPSFMFIVGVAMPYSYASRAAHGDSWALQFRHVVKRAVVLILLGVFLRSAGRHYTYWTFEDVISQIGLAYIFLFMTLGKGIKIQAIVTVCILVGYYLLFALWPLPNEPVDAAAMGLPKDWNYFSGFAAHWNKGLNPAGYFDQWFLNLFSQRKPWSFHPSGYVTLSFIPSMATMLIGIMAGEHLRSDNALGKKIKHIALAGLGCLAFGLAVDGHIWPMVDWEWSIAPIVKKIWTPSFAIFSAGWTLLFLAAFLYVVDFKGYKKWAFPFVVVGMNSIAIYVMEGLLVRWVHGRLETHFGWLMNEVVLELGVVFVLWYICYWMYKRKIFIRV